MDFTFYKYRVLVKTLLSKGFSFITFADFLAEEGDVANGSNKVIILRHDVDIKPQNSLATAIIEAELGIKGSYYFRMVPESFDIEIIKQIASLGHEVGYHYETMDTASLRLNVKREKLNERRKEELIDYAYNEFCENLGTFRKTYPVSTICMHGSPQSGFDNKDIWKKYSYKQLGLLGEPYFDIDFNDFFYLTDTGRCWNGYRFSVRDKMPQQEQWIKDGLVFSRTSDIVRAAHANALPPRIMITVHPQRWTNSPLAWMWELLFQNIKNVVKWFVVRRGR
ncbi:MAG: hypothetical protein JW783_07715 [Bacteroidales bacterium]|nr:hypothetical protein [Bacteroidales bacterium]MBN2750080.1 hypothetical protein [Bacteroidales bacterium]